MQARLALALLLACLPGCGAAGPQQGLSQLEHGMWFRPSNRARRAQFYLANGEPLDDFVATGLPDNASLSLFFVGDSLERFLMSSTCWVAYKQVEADYFERVVQPGCAGSWNNESRACRVGRLSVGNAFFRGFMEEDAHRLCEPGLPPTLHGLFEAAGRAYAAAYGAPQVVLLKSFFWEVKRLCFVTPFPCAEMGEEASAAASLLEVYRTRLAGALRALRRIFPDAVVVLKTDPLWNHSSNRFLDNERRLGVNNSAENAFWLGMELNKAVRRVAEEEAAPVLECVRPALDSPL